MQSHAPIIVALHKAREVAKELGVGAMVPADVQPHHIHEVEVVFGLLKHGTHTFSTPHAEMTAISEQSRVDDDSVVLTPKVAEYSTFQGGGLPFLSTTVDLGFQKLTYSAMRLDESKAVRVDDSHLKVVFVAEADCLCTLRRCTPEETTMLQAYRRRESSE